ncbi:MAG: cellulase family glycosylhydrolase [Chloroflexi bacterium]|nr:cellulase family glycosylhydrolase [Chloroflexota bacterium]
MIYNARVKRLLPASFCLTALALLLIFALSFLRPFLFSLTGEEKLGGQLLGLWQLAGDVIRPRPVLDPDTPIAHTGVNPFGINTFLQQEVEPAKRERQVQMIAEAGFHWIRQEFPWYDIEIDAKGNFDDCRFPPCHSAWDKYDQIVALADSHGLEIIARLSAPPAWSRADGTARGAFAPPDNFDDFADYAAAVATRYAGRVRYFQVWNEPNIYPEWGEMSVDPKAYTALLCRTYRRLKAIDPNIVVLSGALAPTSELTGNNRPATRRWPINARRMIGRGSA